jgi:hypothetical protein
MEAKNILKANDKKTKEKGIKKGTRNSIIHCVCGMKIEETISNTLWRKGAINMM